MLRVAALQTSGVWLDAYVCFLGCTVFACSSAQVNPKLLQHLHLHNLSQHARKEVEPCMQQIAHTRLPHLFRLHSPTGTKALPPTRTTDNHHSLKQHCIKVCYDSKASELGAMRGHTSHCTSTAMAAEDDAQNPCQLRTTGPPCSAVLITCTLPNASSA